MWDECPTRKDNLCIPGGKTSRALGPPDCYEPPLSPGTAPDIIQLFRKVTLAWREGRHVVVAVGEGFNLRSR